MKVECFSLTRVLDVFTGTNHSFILVKNNKGISLRSWGLNNFGQLGHSNRTNTWFPKQIEFFNNLKIKNVSGGDSHSTVLLESGEIYSWGYNRYNQLGHIDTELISEEPIKLEIQNEVKLEEVISASNYNYGYSIKDQKFYSWGFGDSYILGNLKDGDNETKPYLLDNTKIFKSNIVRKISLGNQHVMVLLREIPEAPTGETLKVLSDEEFNEEDLKFEFNLDPFKKAKSKSVKTKDKLKENNKASAKVNEEASEKKVSKSKPKGKGKKFKVSTK